MDMANLARTRKARTDNREVCIGCGESLFTNDYTRGENICTSCGLVASDRIADRGPEWRAFTAEERDAKARTGAPMRLSIADKGLSTTIDWRNKDANGRALTTNTRAAIYRMRKWHIRSRVHSSHHRNLGFAMSEMERLSSQLGIPRDARETAALIYRKALIKRLVRGRSIDSVVAASVYLACRIHRIPRRLDEIVTEAKTNRKQIGQAVRLVISKVNVNVPLASAKDLLPRLSSDLGLEGRTVRKATEIIKRAKDERITIGKDPGGIAGAALYIACILEEDRRTQREIAEVSHVTEVTIRNRYKELVRSLGISLDTDF
ncbi:MAG: transcription initiation factor IIB [Candidatus Thorarchaeota archaeon]|jgi:transcription initiation factor TFIIB